VGHKSHDPCSQKQCMEAGVMTFVAHCTIPLFPIGQSSDSCQGFFHVYYALFCLERNIKSTIFISWIWIVHSNCTLFSAFLIRGHLFGTMNRSSPHISLARFKYAMVNGSTDSSTIFCRFPHLWGKK